MKRSGEKELQIARRRKKAWKEREERGRRTKRERVRERVGWSSPNTERKGGREERRDRERLSERGTQ